MTTETKKLRVAIIGLGRMGLQHARAVSVIDGVQLVAVADPAAKPEAASQVLPTGVRVFTDPKAMLQEIRPDIVHVVTPPHTHLAAASLALEHGANVYVEKPFAQDVGETQQILALARQKGLSVCAGHQVLFQYAGQKYGRYLKSIGKLIHVESYFSFKTVRRGPRGPISAVEQLIDILPHPTYLLLSAFQGESADAPVEVVSAQVDADGEVRATLRKGDTLAQLIVTLNGRPIESYLRIVGASGALRVDFVLSGVTKNLGPGVSAIAAIFRPFSEARQISFGTLATIYRLLRRRHKSYVGLAELLTLFYRSVAEKRPSPVSPQAILETVQVCEHIGKLIYASEVATEERAREAFDAAERRMAPANAARGITLVTGGTGFLGEVFVEEMRNRGWPLRVITRRIPAYADRVPGVEYVRGDIAEQLPDTLFKDVTSVAHLAAETAGGKDEHERNSIHATRRVIEAAARNGVKKFIHVSSIAVLKPRTMFGRPLAEDSPVDRGNLGRGPYVWGKAEAEFVVAEVARANGMGYKIIRLGPLVDFADFAAPGRLGREVGPFYVAVGRKGNHLSVCDVRTAARVLRHYVERFDSAPAVLNLVEAPAPTRGELLGRLREQRPDLSVMWLPTPVLWLISLMLKGVLRLMKPRSKPLDLYAAFASEKYDSRRAAEVIGTASVPLSSATAIVGNA